MVPGTDGLTFQQWVAAYSIERSNAELPLPYDGMDWKEWAMTTLYRNPISSRPITDPRQFDTWQDWVHSFAGLATS